MRKLTLGKIYKNGIQYSGTTDAAININYDNSKGAIKAGNVQGAIDEIMETTSQSRTLTQAEYDALPDTKYTDGIEYFITDAEPLDASTIAYDNTTSKMTATNVQAGIDELNSNLTQVQSQIVPTASIEKGAFASKAYNAGDFLVKNGSLWKATTDITKGDALTPACIVPTTVGGELSSSDTFIKKMKLLGRSSNSNVVELNESFKKYDAIYVSSFTKKSNDDSMISTSIFAFSEDINVGDKIKFLEESAYTHFATTSLTISSETSFTTEKSGFYITVIGINL